MFICACGCGTHVYSTRTGPGHGLRTSYRAGVRPELILACLLHFACVRAVRCSAWIVRAVVYLACVCVCTAVGMCSSTCTLCTAFRMSTRAIVPSLPYPSRSSLEKHGRCTYLPVLVLVLVPLCTVLRLVSPGNVSICPCSYSYPLYSDSLGQHGQ